MPYHPPPWYVSCAAGKMTKAPREHAAGSGIFAPTTMAALSHMRQLQREMQQALVVSAKPKPKDDSPAAHDRGSQGAASELEGAGTTAVERFWSDCKNAKVTVAAAKLTPLLASLCPGKCLLGYWPRCVPGPPRLTPRLALPPGANGTPNKPLPPPRRPPAPRSLLMQMGWDPWPRNWMSWQTGQMRRARRAWQSWCSRRAGAAHPALCQAPGVAASSRQARTTRPCVPCHMRCVWCQQAAAC